MADWWDLVRRNPGFARFLVGEAASLGGEWFSVVAVSVLAVQQGAGEGAWAVAVTIAAHELPRGLVRPFAGVLADRFDRRDLLATVHALQVLLTLVIAWRAAVADLVGVQLLVVARSLVAGMDWPARSGVIRRLVPEDALLTAIALTGALWSAMFAFGMALGGLVTTIGVVPALVVDAATFGFAAAMTRTLPAMPTRGGVRLGEAVARGLADLREAVGAARADPALVRAVTAKVPLALAGGAGLVMVNLVADATAFAGSAAATLGVLQATRGVGIGAGPIVAERLVARGWGLERVWTGVVAVGLLGVAGVAAAGAWPAILAAAALWGFGIGANWMISSAELQRRASDGLIGRLSGLDLLLADAATALSALVGGAVVEGTGLAWAAGPVAVVLGAAAWLARPLQQRARAPVGAGGGRP